jgi:hypothetical protein
VRPLNLHKCAAPTRFHIENVRVPVSIRLWWLGVHRIKTDTSFRHLPPGAAGIRIASVGILLPLFDGVTLCGAQRAISWDRRASWKS